MTDDDDWRHDHLALLARRMVALEQLARRAQARYDHDRAATLWRRRELVQWQRSAFLRDTWAARRATPAT